MWSSFLELSGLNQAFVVCAVVGGFIFTIKTLLMFIGADADVDFDVDTGDMDGGMMWLSIHGLTAFFMMFGLAGLTGTIQFKWSDPVSLLFAFVVGLISIITLTFLKKKLLGLESDGTLKSESAIGVIGEVYLTIPEDGQGKVTLTVQGAKRVMNSISENKVKLVTGTMIEVVSVAHGDVLSVKQK